MKFRKALSGILALSIVIPNFNLKSVANNDISNRYQTLEGEYITIDDSTEGELVEIEIFGNAVQDENNLEDIQSVGDLYVDENGNPILDNKGREQYKIDIISKNKSLIDFKKYYEPDMIVIEGKNILECNDFDKIRRIDMEFKPNTQYTVSFDFMRKDAYGAITVLFTYSDGTTSYGIRNHLDGWQSHSVTSIKNKSVVSARIYNAGNDWHTGHLDLDTFMIEEGANRTSYMEPQSDEITILLPTQLQKVGNIADRLYWDNSEGRYLIEKNIISVELDGSEDEIWHLSRGTFSDVYDHFHIILNKNGYKEGLAGHGKPLISNRFLCTNESWIEGPHSSITTSNSNYTQIGFTFDMGYYNEIDDFKSWLNENPTTVYYQLKTPEIIKTNITSKLVIPTYDDRTHIYIEAENGVNPTLKITVDKMNRIAQDTVIEVENEPTMSKLSLARNIVNQMDESLLKDQLQERLNNLFSLDDMQLERKTTSSNIDVYIKCENMLSLSLSTNSITFDNFGGTENLEKVNAVELIINSSLPYEVNAYLPQEIQNSDKSVILDKNVLNIKANSESIYSKFVDINTKLQLLDNQPADNNVVHGIDLLLDGGIAHQKDVYKGTIKFEVIQK